METEIRVNITGKQMNDIMDKEFEDMSIKYFCAKMGKSEVFEESKVYEFEVSVRHAEGVGALELFNNHLKNLNNE